MFHNVFPYILLIYLIFDRKFEKKTWAHLINFENKKFVEKI